MEYEGGSYRKTYKERNEYKNNKCTQHNIFIFNYYNIIINYITYNIYIIYLYVQLITFYNSLVLF